MVIRRFRISCDQDDMVGAVARPSFRGTVLVFPQLSIQLAQQQQRGAGVLTPEEDWCRVSANQPLVSQGDSGL